VKAYYEHAGITIYHGDCREWLPFVRLDDRKVLITDPPYGIELGTTARGHSDMEKATYDLFDDSLESWLRTVLPALKQYIAGTKRGAVFAGKHVTHLPEPATIGGIFCPAATGRNPWGFSNLIPVYFYGSQPTITAGSKATMIQSNDTAERNGHPCPKPYEWMSWLVQLATERGVDTVVDPFCGSGTTLLAAKNLGRMAVGWEISERYCEIAAKRLSQEVLPLEIAAKRLSQEVLQLEVA
jgi:site-specific DNA-methyltransferase (adenine-specific)